LAVLADNPDDLPAAVVALTDPDGRTARRVGEYGLRLDIPQVPEVLTEDEPRSVAEAADALAEATAEALGADAVGVYTVGADDPRHLSLRSGVGLPEGFADRLGRGALGERDTDRRPTPPRRARSRLG